MADIQDYIDSVKAYLKSAPDALVEEYVRKGIAQFCNDARTWVVSLGATEIEIPDEQWRNVELPVPLLRSVDNPVMWISDQGQNKIYAYDFATKARVPAQDFDTLSPAGNTEPFGLWSDGTTIFTTDHTAERIYAYNLATKARVPDQDFTMLPPPSVGSLVGLWSDGTTMWVSDQTDDKIYAFDFATKARVPDQDFDTLADAGNTNPFGLWSDGTTMWVADFSDDKIYAYDLVTKARVPSQDFDTLIAAGNQEPTGLWSDGTFMYVADRSSDNICAYTLNTKTHVPSLDFTTLRAAGNTNPAGLWSNGRPVVELGIPDDTDILFIDRVYSRLHVSEVNDGALQWQDANQTLTIHRDAVTDGDTVEIFAVLAPKLNAQSVPDWFFRSSENAIRDWAAHKMMQMPDQVWTDQTTSRRLGREYTQFVADVTVRKGRRGTSGRIVMPPIPFL